MFPSNRINLNTATLGNQSNLVREALFNDQDEVNSFPLGQYELGRKALQKSRDLARSIWPSQGYTTCISLGTSQTASLLANALKDRTPGSKVKVLTTRNEHVGGIGAFETHGNYSRHYIEEFKNEKILEDKISALKPDIVFISQVAYANGEIFPVRKFYRLCKDIHPNCLFIVDAAQSLGVLDLPMGYADLILASLHKWLFGPRGTGILWIKNEVLEEIPPFFISGEILDPDSAGGYFELSGGQNFLVYQAIEASFELFKEVGHELIYKRSAYLSDFFKKKLDIANKNSFITIEKMAHCHPGIVPLKIHNKDIYEIYKTLNQKGIYLKCIKDKNLLRCSIPYYETSSRIEKAANILKGELCGKT